ncbi:uncharacterized protein [Onthophagus taurus]|uniref:uncharacterized protein n=1 Tax=Onthophagus taurus TaxID=166361 RepID=UPI0039BDAAB7
MKISKKIILVVFFIIFECLQISFGELFDENKDIQQPPVKLFGQYVHKDYKKRYNSDDDENLSITEYPPLKEFLEKYSKRNQHHFKKQEEQKNVEKNQEGDQKSKTWDLLQVTQYNPHPNNDKKGWISLEAVPWSVSKVSKWQSNIKPQNSNWDDIESNNNQYWTKPHYHHHYNNNNYDPQKPDPRPGYVPSSGNDFEWNSYHKNDDRRGDEDFGDVIITDGRPANFPSNFPSKPKNPSNYPRTPEKFFNRRQSSTDLPITYPSNGDGEWVLLSTTKGYKYPAKRHRSLNIEPESVSTTRSVHLTVLPPTGNSKVNMTTSHGGLLEVESTFETVEDSQREFARKERMKQIKAKPLKHQNQVEEVISAVKKPGKKVDSSAVMAAVGAGIIPATMAMLVPMAMNGKRRRRDLEINQVDVNAFI